MKAFQKNMREEKHKYSWPSFTEEVLNFFDTIKKENLDIFTLQLGIKYSTEANDSKITKKKGSDHHVLLAACGWAWSAACFKIC